MTYTILLARPEGYSADPLDTYCTYAEGDTPDAALAAARLEACQADEWDAPGDYALLLILSGEHPILNHLIEGE